MVYIICFKYIIIVVLTHVVQKIIFNIFVHLFILGLIRCANDIKGHDMINELPYKTIAKIKLLSYTLR